MAENQDRNPIVICCSLLFAAESLSTGAVLRCWITSLTGVTALTWHDSFVDPHGHQRGARALLAATLAVIYPVQRLSESFPELVPIFRRVIELGSPGIFDLVG